MGDEKSDDNLVRMNCYQCAVGFGLTKDMHALRTKDQFDFYCPNGHGQHFLKPAVDPRDTELVTLRTKVTELETRANSLQAMLDELRAELDIWRPRAATETNGATLSPSEEQYSSATMRTIASRNVLMFGRWRRQGVMDYVVVPAASEACRGCNEMARLGENGLCGECE